MDRSLTAYVFFVLVVGLTCLGTGGCQTALSPVAPDPGVTLPTLAAAPSGCPAVEDICDDIGAIVHDACGEPEDYKSRGEYVKCRATTIASELSIYEGCFSMGELRKIAGCVRKWVDQEDQSISEVPQRRSKREFHSQP